MSPLEPFAYLGCGEVHCTFFVFIQTKTQEPDFNQYKKCFRLFPRVREWGRIIRVTPKPMVLSGGFYEILNVCEVCFVVTSTILFNYFLVIKP